MCWKIRNQTAHVLLKNNQMDSLSHNLHFHVLSVTEEQSFLALFEDTIILFDLIFSANLDNGAISCKLTGSRRGGGLWDELAVDSFSFQHNLRNIVIFTNFIVATVKLARDFLS